MCMWSQTLSWWQWYLLCCGVLARLWGVTTESILLQCWRPKLECSRWTSCSRHHVYGTNFHGSYLPSLDRTKFNEISLCSFAVKHLVWVYNRVPNVRSGITPLALITRECSDYKDLLRFHVWGCPVFILEAKLQNNQKLPEWNWQAQMGQFAGFSDKHSSWWPMYAICLPISSLPNSILFLIIYLKQWIGPVLINYCWVYLPWAISIEYWVVNSMQKKNSMKPVILFTSPLPYISLAWWIWTSMR